MPHNAGMRTAPTLFRLACLCIVASTGGTAIQAHARDPSVAQATGATFLVVRHAEKASDDPRDPALSAQGLQRARRLAERLAADPLVATYATAYRRTQQTVAPAAAAHGIDVTTYDAAQPAAEFADALKATHRTGTVLVAGHSNTVPAIVSALCGCEAAPMAEDEFDRISTVRVDADGKPRLFVEHDTAPTQ